MKPREMTKEDLSDLSNLRYVQSCLLSARNGIEHISNNNSPSIEEGLKEARQNIERALLVINNEISKYK
jgi:hypothetical protein